MKLTFRWYGEGRDAISLKFIKQIPGCSGLMGVLDAKAAGEVWEEQEIKEYVVNRIWATQQAIERAKAKFSGDLVLASDAFFPFRDVVDFCAEQGIKAIIQPGGSVKDEDSITAANEHKILMLMTGMRHFFH